ncbi:MAG: 2-phosphosulfolactate phosphatase [Gaiellales bacterium]
MRIDVALSPDAVVPTPAVAIAVDVIRATTTIAYALAQGYHEVVCCPGVEDARGAAAEIGPQAVLAGEVDRLPPEGFALGNSPREYAEGLPLGDVLVLSTTNGTRAVCWAASNASLALVGSLANLTSCAAAAARAARAAKGSVVVRCAGADGDVCLDDSYVAGRLVAELSAYLPEWQLGDTAELVRASAGSYASEIEAIGRSSSAASLREFDLFDDVRICARVDAVPGVIEAVALDGGRARAFSSR